MPKISIITVCLNEVEGVRQTCDSICQQDYRDFEWIVIDGQSTDGTLDVLNEYRSHMARLVSEPDGGIYEAMNKGIGLATGEYLLFLNAGDYLAADNVLSLAAAAPERDILYGDLEMEDNGHSQVIQYPDHLTRGYLLKRMMPHQASFIKKSLFERYGLYDTSFRIAGDYELFTRFLHRHGASSYHIPHVLSVFRIGGISNTKAQRAKRKRENHLVRRIYFPKYRFSLRGLKAEIRLHLGA